LGDHIDIILLCNQRGQSSFGNAVKLKALYPDAQIIAIGSGMHDETILAALAFGANRSSPPKKNPTTDSRQEEKALIGHGEKPSPVVKQSPEVLPPIVKPRNDSQNQVASPAQPANEEANKSEVRADGSQPRSTNSTTRSADHPSFLQFEAGVRPWIRVNSMTRQPDGSFSFRGTLLQPITLAGPVSLDQSTELVGSGTVNGGHVTVSVTGFTVRGENYGLRQAASGVIRKPGSGPAVELNLGKVLEMWLVSASVYEKTRPTGD
jgi:hypothetical protein